MNCKRIVTRWQLLCIAICFILTAASSLRTAEPAAKVYVVLWFDTEDYILPASDDAALKVAEFLTARKRPGDLQGRRREGPHPGTAQTLRRHRGLEEARDRLPLQLP